MKRLLLIILLLVSSICFAQMENNNLILSNKHFLNSTIDSLKVNQIDLPKFANQENTLPGFSSISDDESNLIFYTNGLGLWDRNNNLIINNLDKLNLDTNIYKFNEFDLENNSILGEMEKNLSSIIIKKPGCENIYYVFFNFRSSFSGNKKYSNNRNYYFNKYALYFFTVNYNNFTNKIVIDTKCSILKDSIMPGFLGAVKHKNNKDYWIVIRQDSINQFFSYNITPFGLGLIPVTSQLALTLPSNIFANVDSDPLLSHDNLYSNNLNTDGLIKFSPNKLKAFIELDDYTHKNNITGLNFYSYGYLLDFNPESGVFSNSIEIKITNNLNFANFEFSPNSLYLYLITINYNKFDLKYSLTLNKIDLISNNQNSINSSLKELFTLPHDPPGNYSSGKRTGLDIKLTSNNTLILSNSLDAFAKGQINIFEIKNPSQQDTSKNKIDSLIKITNFINQTNISFYFPNTPAGIYSNVSYNYRCIGSSYTLDIPDTNRIPTKIFNWDGPNNFNSSDEKPKLSKLDTNNEGCYTRIISNTFGKVLSIDSLFLFVSDPLPNLKITTSSGVNYICDSLELSIPEVNNQSILWSDSSNGLHIKISKPGKYSATIYNGSCCSSTKYIDILPGIRKPTIVASSNPFCTGDTVTLSLDSIYHKYLWSNGDSAPSLMVTKGGKYFVTVYDTITKCSDIATIDIIENPKPNAKISASKTNLCLGDSSILQIENYNPSNNKYKWSTGDSTINIIVKKSGIYTLHVTDKINQCTDSTSITINVLDPGNTKIIGNLFICKGGSTELKANIAGAGIKYLWSNGSTNQKITVSDTGKYWCSINLNDICTSSDTIYVNQYPTPPISILGDTTICKGTNITLSASQDYPKYFWNTGGSTKTISISNMGEYSLTITDTNGCTNSAKINITEQSNDIDLNKFQALTFKNNDQKRVRVKSLSGKKIKYISSLQKSSDFKIDSIVNDLIFISFVPKSQGNFNDSLIISILSPCPEVYTVALNGNSREAMKTRVYLPKDTVTAGTKYISIPLTLKIVSNENYPIDLNWTSKVIYNVSLFLPNKENNLVFTINGFKATLDINGSIHLTSDSALLFNITGEPFLSDTNYTDLVIDSFDWDKTGIETEKVNGGLTIGNMCQGTNRLIKFTGNPFNFTISPNPVKDELTITISGDFEGTYSISIFNELGQNIYQNQLINESSKNELKLTDKDLPNGFYNIILSCPYGIYSKNVVIGR